MTTEQVKQWCLDYYRHPEPRPQCALEVYICGRAAEHMRERCAKLCDELRVKGGIVWTEDHAGALSALTEAATAIRALKEGE